MNPHKNNTIIDRIYSIFITVTCSGVIASTMFAVAAAI